MPKIGELSISVTNLRRIVDSTKSILAVSCQVLYDTYADIVMDYLQKYVAYFKKFGYLR